MQPRRRCQFVLRIGAGIALALASLGCRSVPGAPPEAVQDARPRAAHDAEPEAAHDAGPPIPPGFVATDFGAEDTVTIAPDAVSLEPGAPLSGVTYTGALPTPPYTLAVEFTKRYGSDFPLAITFPVAGSHLSLVLGGWGGTVCGLSSLDGLDAARNATRFVRAFPVGVRTRVELDVEAERVAVRLDGVPVLDVPLAGRAVGVRAELEPCKPLGLAAFATATTIHSFRVRAR